MRNQLKAATVESKFPLLAVEHDCIVSKDADITVASRVDLPELYTVTSAEYEAIHSAWAKAIKVLPDYSVMHKQVTMSVVSLIPPTPLPYAKRPRAFSKNTAVKNNHFFMRRNF